MVFSSYTVESEGKKMLIELLVIHQTPSIYAQSPLYHNILLNKLQPKPRSFPDLNHSALVA